MNLVSLRTFANNSGFSILFWHNSSSNVMKNNAALSVSKREPYKRSSNRRCGNGLFLILLFWFNLVYCFFSSFFLGQFLIPHFINIQHTNLLGKTMENPKFTMMLSSMSKVADLPEGMLYLARLFPRISEKWVSLPNQENGVLDFLSTAQGPGMLYCRQGELTDVGSHCTNLTIVYNSSMSFQKKSCLFSFNAIQIYKISQR